MTTNTLLTTKIHPVSLGLDAGGSGTKWALLHGNHVMAGGYASPLTAALLDTALGAQTLAELRAALPATVDALHIGLPGLGSDPQQIRQVRRRLGKAFGLPDDHIQVENDLALAYQSHLAPGEGVLVYAGTGSIAYAVAADGRTTRAGGRGYRIGDEGGGASLGRMALHWVTDHLDTGQQAQGPLAEQISAITGGLDWDTLRQFVYGVPGASSLAKVAPAVTRAAEQGDMVALAIIEQAARDLARLAGQMQQQLRQTLPIVATGGALRSPPLQEALRRVLPGVTIQFRNHAEVAASLAQQRLSLSQNP